MSPRELDVSRHVYAIRAHVNLCATGLERFLLSRVNLLSAHYCDNVIARVGGRADEKKRTQRIIRAKSNVVIYSRLIINKRSFLFYRKGETHTCVFVYIHICLKREAIVLILG